MKIRRENRKKELPAEGVQCRTLRSFMEEHNFHGTEVSFDPESAQAERKRASARGAHHYSRSDRHKAAGAYRDIPVFALFGSRAHRART